ncbi:MAG: class I poly(R)-hydroxyalkanoic acid synthase [Burkholderiaceae bacterium]|jgi:polyhydroxyalkanoate synthase|nr:class I poly(R)-hydroxyalkanoic acid synthase [Burkholderiaceae bacterium]
MAGRAGKRTARPAQRTDRSGGRRAATSAGAGAGDRQRGDDAAAANPWLAIWSSVAESLQANVQPAAPPSLSFDGRRVADLQNSYVEQLTGLWRDCLGQPQRAAEPIADKRFADPAWQENPLASFYARAYLLNAEFMNRLADAVQTDRKTKRRVKFAVSQFVDAASPANYLALNPKAQKTLLESGGESLKAGVVNLLKDMQKGRISQTDESAFEIGRNVATTEGMVVFENRLFQLIQYKPLTAKVRARPFLFVPPSINKYYILDLQPDNSMVRYAVEQGNTVFLVSWKNPQQPERNLTWDDYVEHGAIEAIRVVQEISGHKQINVLGFCVGGTILASALAVMYARGEDPASSLTMMTSLLDFEDAGVLEVFIDEAHVRGRERQLAKGGLMAGKDLANTFSSLRPNDLVWNYVVSNYLEGRQPPAFDLLYWNSDGTNLPGPMYCWYLRNMYLENRLRVANALHCCGEPIDLGRIRVPTYVFSAVEDHIVPWKAGYASARLLPGDKAHGTRFVLGASGHIAGSINPASKNKRSYWAPTDHSLPANSEAWLHDAVEKPGSWWVDWNEWLKQFAGGEKAAPKSYGSAKYRPIEPAPGRYVKEKA